MALAVTWHGLDTFMDELRLVTAELVHEADVIMLESAEAAKRDIAAAYPLRKGGLRRGLVLRPARGTVISGAQLRQTAPHGHLYERGTVVRHTHAGAHRGRMPVNPTFVPIATAYRRTAISEVINRLYAHGASRVTGGPTDEESAA